MTAIAMSRKPRLVPVEEIPSSRREWRKYVEIQIEEGDGWGPETELLRVLAGRRDLGDDGTVPMGVQLLMRKLKKSKSTVKAHLAALRERGVLETRLRGRRVPVHQLLAVPVEQQLSFFDDVGCGDSPAAAPADRPAASVATALSSQAADAGRVNTVTTHPSSPVDRSQGSRFSDPAVCRQVTATEDGARERARTASDVLCPSLPAVLEILERAPGLNVVDAAVNAALLAHPSGDHERAAYEVVSWAHEGGLSHTAANRLLMSALRRQRDERSRRPEKSCRDRGRGRRRRQPVDTGVPGTGPAAVEALREMRRAMAIARGEDPDA